MLQVSIAFSKKNKEKNPKCTSIHCMCLMLLPFFLLKEKKCLAGYIANEHEGIRYGSPRKSHAKPSRYLLGAQWGAQEFPNWGLEKRTC